jgi:hypothetical protein
VKRPSREIRSRRELFAGVLRYAALGLIAAGGTALLAKRQRLVRKGRCINNSGVCTGCKVLERCSLPQAVSARKTLMGVNNGNK